MRRLLRALGTLMIVAGIATLGWAVVVWRWEDPVTSLYTAYKQRGLADSYERRLESFRPPTAERGASLVAVRRQVAQQARRYRRGARRGEAIARLEIPRLGLSVVVVNGTDTESLKRGPGRYPGSYMPGEGELVYVAGHRTTYGAPFSKIDALRPGDRVTVQLPYATFEYRISGYRIVPADRISVLRSSGRELLALQACHPRFFATQRYIAYARPVRVIPRGRSAYAPTRI